MRQAFADGFLRITGALYLILMVNLLVILTTGPVIALVVATDLTRSWLAVGIVSPLLAPAVWAAFASFRAYQGGDLTIARTYLRSWQAAWRRVGPYGLAGALLFVIVVVDVLAVAGREAAYAVVPALAIVALLATGALFLALAATEEFSTVGRLAALKVGLYYAVRSPQRSLISLVATGTWLAAVNARPVLALSVATAPVLYLIWANCRAALRPLRQQLTPDEPGSLEPGRIGSVLLRRDVEREAAA
jgi:uncharacterized membrane protein YesL